MGILDVISRQVLGGGEKGAMVNAIMEVLGNQQSGGLQGVIGQFASKGLGDIVNSWVSTGGNLPITPQQIQQGLGNKTIAQIASKAGVSAENVTSQLTHLLPQVVDKLTPEGKIPQGDIMVKGMDLLKGLLK